MFAYNIEIKQHILSKLEEKKCVFSLMRKNNPYLNENMHIYILYQYSVSLSIYLNILVIFFSV